MIQPGKMILVKLILGAMLTGLVVGCAGPPPAPMGNQAGDHIVQGGSFTGEGMIYVPLHLPDDHK